MDALIVIVRWNVLVGARPITRALPTNAVRIVEGRRIVLAVGVVCRHDRCGSRG